MSTPDATPIRVNRTQLARAMGVTMLTIDDWIARGMPVEKRGWHGTPYEFDLEACQSWRRREEERRQLEREQQEAVIRGLEPPDDAFDTAAASFTPERRKAVYDAEFAWRREALARGELMRASDVAERFENAFKFLAQGLQSLPDVLGRQCGLSADEVLHLQAAIDQWQEDLALTLMNQDQLEP